MALQERLRTHVMNKNLIINLVGDEHSFMGAIGSIAPSNVSPLSSSTHHLSNDDCPEDKSEDY